ncbi:threonine ammonia-lyase IlvA [Bacillus licheniformis]|jgi:threonine dehydratase|uniref:L-threonine dehydratase n=2 Tax=Bacillus licheniformis TaxID=1402 RepID=Q65IB9_BACLD|nr:MULTISPECIES: threonine ammonia-lyase IlvA [Bacillus]MBY8346901.1 threonine dehydratase [Bacillus sp. PCH94]MDP4079655.1 threonine ammonia-lyase IlvA [Bacillota bacterium]AAU23839.1 threonine dehydratase [Bacillus licheniformis DSM 13 = ATCC 14580]AAU41195.1 threonine dehydratase IlvA [Bacillus licheniformis DSM 13 = ATCC 14580]AKQ73508.1 threonine dehydratase [Bacillus licheniformis WX-02]
MKPLLKENSLIQVKDILKAHQNVKDVVIHTPLQKNERLSERYDCNVYLKREDLQVVRSFKLRGAYYKMKQLSKETTKNGVVCASAGNHAQGVAFSCKHLGIHGKIFMPSTTPRQKISQVELFGKEYVEIILTGDTFDDAYQSAVACCEEEKRAFIHPFDDPAVMAGQGTVAVEILNDIETEPHYLFASVGGGGLLSGVGTYMKNVSPDTKLIAVEPKGAPALFESNKKGEVVILEKIDKFVDGAAVQKIGEETFKTLETVVDDILLVPEGKVCTAILELYNQCAIVAEPAGALPIAALDLYRDEIKGKNVVCIVSGGNNDIGRMQEIKDRSMMYEGLQHYFIVNFPQRAGALREFLDEVLGPTDDITRFEYTKKNNKSSGPALVGIELKQREDYEPLIARMDRKGFRYVEVNKDEGLFHLLI